MKEALAQAAARLNIGPQVISAALAALDDVAAAWQEHEARAVATSAKVTGAFVRAGIDESHLGSSTGYAYHDRGREAFEALIASVMDAPAALARPQLVSATHAIVATLRTLLPRGGRLCSLTGRPYDTLQMAIVDHPNGLVRDHGIEYIETPWPSGQAPSAGDLRHALAQRPHVAFIQRSRGYAPRPALSLERIAALIEVVRAQAPDALVVVDNCYGEFVELQEPGAVGADASIGSFIKNPGGGIAVTGAYIAGRSDVIDRIADGIFAPGLGRAVGPMLETMRGLFAGLHRAPRAVTESLKTLDFAAALFARLGYRVDPPAGAQRGDIIQAIALDNLKAQTAFVRGLQRWLPVNSRTAPEPGDVPGYADPVIMAIGAFVSGATSELSCDAPLRAPYEVYLQGGLDVAHGMLAVMSAAASVVERA